MYVRPAFCSGSLALNVASVPSKFSATVSALSLTLTPPAAANETSAGSSTLVTVMVNVTWSLRP